MLDLPDLLNLDLLGGLFWVRLDDEKVRMRAGFDLLAGSALATTVETFCLWGPFAVECLCETNGRQSFPDRFLAVEQIGMSQALMADGGLQKGDLVTEVDGERVTDGISMIVAIRAHQPGETLEFTLTRSGQERTLKLTLDSEVG